MSINTYLQIGEEYGIRVFTREEEEEMSAIDEELYD